MGGERGSAQMPHFPTYIVFTIDKLLTGYVAAAKQFQNDKAIKETAIASLQMEHYCGPTHSFYCTMTKLDHCSEDKMVWDVVPDYIPNVLYMQKRPGSSLALCRHIQPHSPCLQTMEVTGAIMEGLAVVVMVVVAVEASAGAKTPTIAIALERAAGMIPKQKDVL